MLPIPLRWHLLLYITCVALSDHDLYILPDAFSVAPKFKLQLAFHNGDAIPESEAAPALARLLNAHLIGAKGTFDIQNLKISGKRTMGIVTLPDSPGNFLLSVLTIPNLIELQPDISSSTT